MSTDRCSICHTICCVRLILQFISNLMGKNLKLNSKVRMTSNGIVVMHGDKTVNLDPKRGTGNGISFVSHAHLDHLHNQKGQGVLIASRQTTEIAKLRGYLIENYVEEYENFSMIDAGQDRKSTRLNSSHHSI